MLNRDRLPSVLPPEAMEFARRARAIIAARLLRGNSVECPVCDGSFRRFREGSARRPGTICPHCGSFARHRLMWLFLQRSTTFFHARLDVLHIAPEWGLQPRLRAMPTLNYLSVDLHMRHADLAMDITDLAFPAAMFDVVLCSHVLEHVPDDHKAMSEVVRVLRPTGWALMDAPLDWSMEASFEDDTLQDPDTRRAVFGSADHVRRYGRDYADRLRNAGFEVEIDPISFSPEEIRRYGLSPVDDHIFLCRPSASRH